MRSHRGIGQLGFGPTKAGCLPRTEQGRPSNRRTCCLGRMCGNTERASPVRPCAASLAIQTRTRDRPCIRAKTWARLHIARGLRAVPIHRVAMLVASAIDLAHGYDDWMLDRPRASRGLSQIRTGECRAAPLPILVASLQVASRARVPYLEFKTERA